MQSWFSSSWIILTQSLCYFKDWNLEVVGSNTVIESNDFLWCFSPSFQTDTSVTKAVFAASATLLWHVANCVLLWIAEGQTHFYNIYKKLAAKKSNQRPYTLTSSWKRQLMDSYTPTSAASLNTPPNGEKDGPVDPGGLPSGCKQLPAGLGPPYPARPERPKTPSAHW